jgi:hypothetical protein
MELSHAERGRRGGLAAQAKLTPTERAEAARRARRALAVREIVAQWPTLDPEQVAKLRSLLRQPGGDAP